MTNDKKDIEQKLIKKFGDLEQKLIKWFGDMPTVLYRHKFDETYIYTVKYDRAIYIIRIFWVFDRWELSQDAMISPKDGSGLPELEVKQ